MFLSANAGNAGSGSDGGTGADASSGTSGNDGNGGGNVIRRAEFSIPSAVISLSALRELRTSEDASKRAMYGKMMKNAAAMQMLSMLKGPYRQ